MKIDAKLSKRELEVAEILAFAINRQSAADKLCISEGTLSAHSYRIYEKLDITSKSELVIWWFVKCLGINRNQIPYFKTIPAVLISLGLIMHKHANFEIIRRSERTTRIELIEPKITL